MAFLLVLTTILGARAPDTPLLCVVADVVEHVAAEGLRLVRALVDHVDVDDARRRIPFPAFPRSIITVWSVSLGDKEQRPAEYVALTGVSTRARHVSGRSSNRRVFDTVRRGATS